jgi:hypothetical protein
MFERHFARPIITASEGDLLFCPFLIHNNAPFMRKMAKLSNKDDKEIIPGTIQQQSVRIIINNQSTKHLRKDDLIQDRRFVGHSRLI